MAIYLFSQILKFTQYSIKLIEKLSRQHLINSLDVFVINLLRVSLYIFYFALEYIFEIKNTLKSL